MGDVVDFEQQKSELRVRFGEDCVFHRAKRGPVFVFKKPTREIWKKFLQAEREDHITAIEALAMDCMCHPEVSDGKPEYTALTDLFDSFPALPERLGLELKELVRGPEVPAVELRKLQAKHGDENAFYVHRGEAFVFSKPARAVWKKFILLGKRKGLDPADAGEQLVTDCLAHPVTSEGKPDHTKLVALLEDLPARSEPLFDELCDLAQGGEQSSGKL